MVVREKTMENPGTRPAFEEINSSEIFRAWYWKKSELVVICKGMALPYSGSKFELRDRIIYALDNKGKLIPSPPKAKKKSRFNWAKETLHLNTQIDDQVSFGPNFRNFMKSQIGPRFSCHKDFMDWVKAHPGKTLEDAIQQWLALEERNKAPHFKREIAPYNMYNQYLRDFLEAHPHKSLQEAQHYWQLKKQLPAPEGRVFYEAGDLELDS